MSEFTRDLILEIGSYPASDWPRSRARRLSSSFARGAFEATQVTAVTKSIFSGR